MTYCTASGKNLQNTGTKKKSFGLKLEIFSYEHKEFAQLAGTGLAKNDMLCLMKIQVALRCQYKHFWITQHTGHRTSFCYVIVSSNFSALSYF